MLDPNVLRIEAPSDPASSFVVWGASELVTSVQATAPWHGTTQEQALDGAGAMKLVLPTAGGIEVLVLDHGEPVSDVEVYARRPSGNAREGTFLDSIQIGSEDLPRFDRAFD